MVIDMISKKKAVMLIGILVVALAVSVFNAKSVNALENYYSSSTDGHSHLDSIPPPEWDTHWPEGYYDMHDNAYSYGGGYATTGGFFIVKQSQQSTLDNIIYRAFLFFENTGNIANDAVIIGARVVLFTSVSNVPENDFIMVLQGTSVSPPLNYSSFYVGNFSNTYSSVYLPINLPLRSEISMILNSAGINYINKTGSTNFGLRHSDDVGGVQRSFYFVGALTESILLTAGEYTIGGKSYLPRLDLVFDNDNIYNWPLWYDNTPKLQITPENGASGTLVNLTGENYTPNDNVWIYITTSNPFMPYITYKTFAENDGSLDYYFNLPLEIENGENTDITAYDVAKDMYSNSVTFFVTSKIIIQLYPTSGGKGQLVNITGSGFADNAFVYINKWNPTTILGALLNYWAWPHYSIGVTQADENGVIDYNFYTPSGSYENVSFNAFDNTYNTFSNEVWFYVTEEIVLPTEPIPEISDEDINNYVYYSISGILAVIMTAIGGVYFGGKGALIGCFTGISLSVIFGLLPLWTFLLIALSGAGILFLILR